MVKLDRIYTRGGDKGETSLGDGARRVKSDVRVRAFGAVDEANAAVGLACCAAGEGDQAVLRQIQNDLFDVGADLCVPLEREGRLRLGAVRVEWLEERCDAINANLAPLNSFILPGGAELSARLHMGRTLVRRAERDVVALGGVEKVNPCVLRYLNRLSDLLFLMARQGNDGADVLWRPGGVKSS